MLLNSHMREVPIHPHAHESRPAPRPGRQIPGERSQPVVPSPWVRDSERGPQIEAQREKHSTMEIKQSLNPGQISVDWLTGLLGVAN